jgi:hypothetical protein
LKPDKDRHLSQRMRFDNCSRRMVGTLMTHPRRLPD